MTSNRWMMTKFVWIRPTTKRRRSHERDPSDDQGPGLPEQVAAAAGPAAGADPAESPGAAEWATAEVPPACTAGSEQPTSSLKRSGAGVPVRHRSDLDSRSSMTTRTPEMRERGRFPTGN